MISQTTYNRLSITAFTIIIVRMLVACALPSDPRPVQSYELDGAWCDDGTRLDTTTDPPTLHYAGRTCLYVYPDTPNAHYIWSTPGCTETGVISGGLEFDPATASPLCMAPDPYLYSASAQWSPSGLTITVDQSPSEQRAHGINETVTLELNYTHGN